MCPVVVPMIPGELAFNCLQSVPLHSDQALGVTGSLLPYVEFQSRETFPITVMTKLKATT